MSTVARSRDEPLGFRLVDRGALPDSVLRAVIWARFALRLARRPRTARRRAALVQALADEGATRPVTEWVDAANAQHYEVPTALFELVLGPRLKYSSGYWPPGVTTVAAAEEAMLELTAARARLADGQDVLDLGCGWGSFTLWLAARHPRSRVLAVSNSATQRAYIEAQARTRGLDNVAVVTCDVADFVPDRTFDRVVSVEMFEHVANHRELLRRIATWLRPDGALFVHIFSHRDHAWRFDAGDPDDWVARYFFAGGVMPAHELLIREQRDLALQAVWRESGRHYARTLDAWLARMDAQEAQVRAVLGANYGADADAWWHRWRTFFLVSSTMCRFGRGREFGVSHYRFVPRAPGEGDGHSGPGAGGAGGVRKNA